VGNSEVRKYLANGVAEAAVMSITHRAFGGGKQRPHDVQKGVVVGGGGHLAVVLQGIHTLVQLRSRSSSNKLV
jgi:hypothetical protein